MEQIVLDVHVVHLFKLIVAAYHLKLVVEYQHTVIYAVCYGPKLHVGYGRIVEKVRGMAAWKAQ